MIKKFCDVCDKEIKEDCFTIIVQRKEPKEKAVIINDACKICANKVLDVIDPYKFYSRGK